MSNTEIRKECKLTRNVCSVLEGRERKVSKGVHVMEGRRKRGMRKIQNMGLEERNNENCKCKLV